MADAVLNNNKRIAKNTMLLYFRMLITMAVSLYTSRIVLRTLGVEDFGIYNVVGGVVAMFGFLNTAMTSTTQRYITYSLGKGDKSQLKRVFSNCLLTHFLIAVVFLLLVEIVGMWLLNYKLVIPMERASAAQWVFHCSVISTFILIVSIPYNADIVAHEKMSAFAYISIFEVFLKLAAAISLCFVDVDKLFLYAILLMIAQLVVRGVYGIYCHKSFEETHVRLHYDKALFREMLSFTGWNLWGGLSNILYTQGINVLLNLFFGPAVNAARGVSVQIQSAVNQFSSSFQMAINPQITKTYANNDLKQMHTLVFSGSRFTVLLLLVLTTPFFVDAELILSLWLGSIPKWSAVFVRLMLCIVIVDAAANPFMIASAATGRIRLYQLIIGGTMLLIVPSAYIALRLGGAPYLVFAVHLFYCSVTFVIRLFIVRSLISFKILDYIKASLSRIVLVSFVVAPVIVASNLYLGYSLFQTTCILLGSTLFTAVVCFSLGLSKLEKEIVVGKIKKIARRFL